MLFQNRIQAGEKLAIKLLSPDEVDPDNIEDSRQSRRDPRSKDRDYKVAKNLIVLAIPRGGIAIGKLLSKSLRCPLDIIVTKKIGAPNNPELAIGAIGPGGEEAIDEELAERVGADEEYIKNQKSKIKIEIARRVKEYRGKRPPLNLKDKIVILTDDGVATGATMLAAIEVVRQHEPKKIIVAVPVIARDSLAKIEKLADEVVYLDAPRLFFAVGQFYQNFSQVTDDEVVKILSPDGIEDPRQSREN